MLTPDQGFLSFQTIKNDFAEFVALNGQVTEADTRAKFIDRILKESLGWPEALISRETYVQGRGYQDYVLTVRGKRHITVEAKREGIPFTLPGEGKHKYLKLSGALSTNAEIKEAIEQVRSYCSEQSIRYAVATNGNAWIIFRANREDIPWKDGQALVFKSIEYILANFALFWNTLAYESVCSGSLDNEFGSSQRIERKLFRVTERLHAADSPLQRNHLHHLLHPLISAIFEDIADQAEIEILKSCYVHSKSLMIVAEELGGLIQDEIPQFLKAQGTQPIDHGPNDAGTFGNFVKGVAGSDKPYICLILGGIGSGKSTFLKRYQRTVGKQLLDTKTLWFSIDFLTAPVDANQLETFVWDAILEQLRNRYKDEEIESRKNLKNAYKSEIKALKETVLRGFSDGSIEYENTLSPYLEQWRNDKATHVTRVLSLLKPQRNAKAVLFFDNVDQLSASYQAKIFLLAQRVTDKIQSVTVVAMREESYYTASVQNTFTAYTNHKFHIASPLFIRLIKSRIDYAKKLMASKNSLYSTSTTVQDIAGRNDIRDFLNIVEDSVLGSSKAIVYFIEALCFGNMRLALEMFTTFLASGATDVGKMLYIYRRQRFYDIAYHEFVKAIMLGDRKYYKESASPILNVFDCGIQKNASHFTTLRILTLLMQSHGISTIEGRGYFNIGHAKALFEDVFDNGEDFLNCIDRLVRRQLIEVNTRSTETSADATHMRITSSGWYYATRLVKSFVYLDLVLQDTPLNDDLLAEDLQRSVYKVNNLHDVEADKRARVTERFSRVSKFIEYLALDEKNERERFGLNELKGFLSEKFSDTIREEFNRQSGWISRRLVENRIKFEEEAFFTIPDEERALIGMPDQVAQSDDQVSDNEE